MTPVDSVRTVLSKYATFSGRARRSEFWWFNLATTVTFLVIELAVAATSSRALAIFGILVALSCCCTPSSASSPTCSWRAASPR